MGIMNLKINEGLSFDDVLLIPGYTDIAPGEADVTSRLIGNIFLNVPIMSAAMDTVTDARMAIALALEGGVGVIHRNFKPHQQAEEVEKVKRYLNWVIKNPSVIDQNATLGDLRNLMVANNASGIPVVNRNKRLCGIITSRDLRFCTDDRVLIKDIMTKKVIYEKGTPSVESAQKKFDTYKIEKLPVIDEKHRVIGLLTYKDMDKKRRHPNAAMDGTGRLLVGAAISPKDYDQRIPLLMESNVDFVIMDTATGDTKESAAAIRDIKKKYNILVMGGNTVTAEATKRLIDAGADAVKIGIGPGSICTTRIISGCGMPQFSAVLDCAEEAAKYNIPVVADGGIKYSGDIVKALAAGANAVMIGNLFAGLKEAPGREIIYEGRIFKEYRGMGSLSAIGAGSGDRYCMKPGEDPVPEGIEGRVAFKGELKPYLHQLVTGIKKGMAYCGCHNIDELKKYRKFIKITGAGLKESHVHDISITHEAPNYSK